MIGDKLGHSGRDTIGQQDEELPTRVGEYLGIGVALHLGLRPDLVFFAGGYYCGEVFVHLRVLVQIPP